MSLSTSLEVAQWLAVAVLAICLLAMTRVWVRAVEHPVARRQELQLGDLAPPVEGLTLSADSETVLVFLTNACLRCADALEVLRTVRRSDNFDLVLVFREGAAALDTAGADRVIENAPAAFDDYDVSVTPTACVIDTDARVAALSPVGSDRAVASFIASLTNGNSGRAVPANRSPVNGGR